MSIPITIPLLNPNEPEALLVSLYVREGQQVQSDDLICSLETTKATAEVTAETSGYIHGLRFEQGQTVHAGDVLCLITENLDEPISLETEQIDPHAASDQPTIPTGLRITQPALALAQKVGLDLAQLPVGPLVTVGMVQNALKTASAVAELPIAGQDFDPTALIIYGGGGHCKIVIDLLRALDTFHIAGIVDDGRQAGTSIMGVPVLGDSAELPRLHQSGVRLALNAVGGINNIDIRIKIFQKLAEIGFTNPILVHPRAYVERSANLSPGVQVLYNAYIGGDARIGFGCIVSTGSIVSHDCQIGAYVNISPGAILAGEITIGDGALIGMGAILNMGIKIGQRARIGNGATVNADVPDGGIVRAGTTWPG